MQNPSAAPSVQKTIYFYRVRVGMAGGQPKPFQYSAVLAHVQGLGAAQRLVSPAGPDQPSLMGWVDQSSPRGHVRLANVRRDGFPQVELSGALSELAVPPGGGLAEVIHAVFLPNNVLGAVFNFYGPRAPRLAEYLRTVAASVCPAEISVAPLLRHDVSTSLQKLKSIKILTLRVDKAAIEAVKRANETVGLALAATLEAAEGSEVEIVLRTKRRSRLARLAEPMVQFVRDLAQLPEVVRPGSKLLVKGEFDGETTLRELDIVREEFFLKRTIPLANQKTRALETTAAYTAISSAYEIMKADIEAASSVQLHE